MAVAAPMHLHRQLLPHFQSLLEQQAARGSSLSPSFYQHTAAKPWLASSVLLMPVHRGLQLFHMSQGIPPLDPCSQKPLGMACLPAAFMVCKAPAGSSLSSASAKPTPRPKPNSPRLPNLHLQPQHCRYRQWCWTPAQHMLERVQIVGSKSVVSNSIDSRF